MCATGPTPVLWLLNWPPTICKKRQTALRVKFRAAADSLLTPEQEQVKKDTGFVMGHLQALRHIQQRAELCRKAQK